MLFRSRLSQSDDWEICYRIASRYRIGYVAEVLVKYRLHGAGIHTNIPRMERDMMLALEKAFTDPSMQSLRKHAYGRLHRILAGCYFQARKPRQFIWHMLKSLRYDPRNLRYFAAYPWRLIARARAATPAA